MSARVVIGLSAVVVAVTEEAPHVLVTRGEGGLAGLPFGPFDPGADRTLELSLRQWVSEQTGFEIGYVEQLYTFGDRGRQAPLPDAGTDDRVISVGYLALTPDRTALGAGDWRDWYRFFPWEDRRQGAAHAIAETIVPELETWCLRARTPELVQARRERVRLGFAQSGAPWNEERALDRYELLYEAGLAPEAARDRARLGGDRRTEAGPAAPGLGEPMQSDHRRILATAMSRLRAKIKYRPVVFELMPETFTLLQLQRVVESISGLELHKQNFRRLLERGGLVEGAGQFESQTGGRPAQLFRFRREGLRGRPLGGVNVPAPRG